ncbi:carbohydrate kinase [Vagococcus hydrophili]|uniref:Carbohydrate kinase n=2 Tax=Vagococcus hydrophili TaxID=2714947 RepID=A0A6G8AXN9_9ENTE|nr:carbohydrate kinase [Vagococcus hydrophili]
MDIAGLSGKNYHEQDSNIGEINLSIGGVGQNIAQNLTRLEAPTYLITVYGDDSFGGILEDECLKNQINLDYAKKIPGAHSSTYLYVANNQGDMVTAINDMSIVKQMTPDFLAERLDFINQAEIVVIDGNVSKESVEFLASHVTPPIFVDPVSIAKVDRFENVLANIDTIKPNVLEAELLTGIQVTDIETGKKAALCLNQRGVKNVFISLGEKGILCSRHDEEPTLISPIADQIISTNGAGDCTMATIAWARFYYGDCLALKEIGQISQAAASITMASPLAVSPELNIKNVIHRTTQYMEFI